MKAPKPCPFCGAQLEWTEHPCRALPGAPTLKLWIHPRSNCYASRFEVPEEELPLWNRRAKGGAP